MSSPRRPRVYLAGPEVFLPDARTIAAEKRRLAAEAGCEGIFPLDGEIDLTGLGKAEQARRIAAANEWLMRSCDALIANLTPFRGVSMDAGTAFEVGFMRALGRPVAGYTNVTDDYFVRTHTFRKAGGIAGDGDRPDVEIENFGLSENLMIEIAIQQSGGTVVRTQVPAGTEMTDLDGFRQCLSQLAAMMLSR